MRYGFGVDLGGTTVKIAYFNEEGNLLQKWEIPTVTEGSGSQILPDIAASINGFLFEKGIGKESVIGIGIGVPGPVDGKGTVNKCINLGWGVFNIHEALGELTGLPVRAGNDANVAALGESWKGGGEGCDNMILATLGTGVGGGIVIDGKVYSGFNCAGGELGHMVIEYNGKLCSCGRRGCWEAYSSATGLTNMTKEKVLECRYKRVPSLMVNEEDANGKVSARTAFSAMKKGDVAAKEVVDKYIRYLACGLSNVINIFQPEVLSIGGGVCNEREWLLNPLMELLASEQYTRDGAKQTKVLIAELGNDAGIIGAAGLGLQ
jgi:glucokinase